MAQLVRQFRVNPYLRNLAALIVQPLDAKDWMGEISALFDYVRNNVRYFQDINGVETLQTPLATLHMGHGDCDDMCILLSALLETAGFQTQFVAIGFEAGAFDHVYIEVMEPDTLEMIPLDPTEPNEVGWSAPAYVCRIDFPVPA